MAQYAVLIDANDSAHAPDPTAAETASSDQHADEPAVAGTHPVLREGGGVEVRPVHSGGVVGHAGG